MIRALLRLAAEKVRWWLVPLLDRLPWTCWAQLCSWAVNGGEQGDGPGVLTAPGRECRAESAVHRDRSCWCGKYRDGQLAAHVSGRQP